MADYITPYGMNEIQKRINQLLHERPEILKAIAIAREMGDLSENAEYKSAKERKGQIDREVDYLNLRKAKLKVLDPDSIPKDKVRFGAKVEVEDVANNTTTKWYLVGSDEVNFFEDGVEKISIESPIGRCFIGKQKGEIAIAKTPKGERKFKILSIN